MTKIFIACHSHDEAQSKQQLSFVLSIRMPKTQGHKATHSCSLVDICARLQNTCVYTQDCKLRANEAKIHGRPKQIVDAGGDRPQETKPDEGEGSPTGGQTRWLKERALSHGRLNQMAEGGGSSTRGPNQSHAHVVPLRRPQSSVRRHRVQSRNQGSCTASTCQALQRSEHQDRQRLARRKRLEKHAVSTTCAKTTTTSPKTASTRRRQLLEPKGVLVKE